MFHFEEEKLSAIVTPLLNWYQKNARILPWRENKDPYRIWISEIMLQQTRVEAAKSYYLRFLEALPDVKALAEVSEEELLKLWEGLGYYSRARNLWKAAKIVCEEYGGVFPNEQKKILALPGIGEYTAGAICSIAFEQPTPAVDGNVLRVLARLFACPVSIDDPKLKKQAFADLKTVYPKGQCGDFTQSLMELGALICLPNGSPKCEECPLKALCLAAAENCQLEFPVKKAKTPRKKITRTVFLLRREDRVALRKRQENGVLSGMWEFPGIDKKLTKKEVEGFLSEEGIIFTSVAPGPKHKHIFTHLEWEMESFLVCCKEKDDRFLWSSEAELKERYSLPSAFKKFAEWLFP